MSENRFDDLDADSFEARVLKLCEENEKASDALVSGSVQMLGLDNLKKNFGDNWEKVRSRVATMVEAVVIRHLSGGDIFFDMGNDQYVVLFQNLSAEEGHKKAAQIGRDIDVRLAGDEAGQEIIVETISVELPRDDPSQLANQDNLNKMVKSRVDQKREKLEAVIPNGLAESHIEYWPVANMAERQVSGYYATPVLSENRDFLEALSLPGGAIEIEVFVLNALADYLRTVDKDGDSAFLCLPIHYRNIVNDKYREKLMEVLRHTPESANHFLYIILTDVPEDILQTNMARAIGYMGPMVAGFICQFSPGFNRFRDVKSGAIKGFGIYGGGLDFKDQKTVMDISQFADASEESGTPSCILNLPTREAGTMARKLGYTFVQGPGVAPPMRSVGPVFDI